MSEWFYGKDGQQHGPMDEATMKARAASGEIGQTDLVWKEGMAEWLPLSKVAELSAGVAAASPEASPYTSPASNPMGAAPQGGMPIAPPTSGLAIASLVLGIIGLIACYVNGLFAIPAVICGHMALKRTGDPQKPVGGRGMAIAGLVMGYLGILLQIFFAVVIGTVASSGEFQKAIEEAQKAQNAPSESYEDGQ